MQIWSCAIHKREFKYLAQMFGYKVGIFGGFRWNEENAILLAKMWADKYKVSKFIRRYIFHKSNLQIDAIDQIVHDMILRTLIRPLDGLSRKIPGKPLPDEYEKLL